MKKRHHYLPQFYLKYWSSDKKKIYQYTLNVSNEKVPNWGQKSIKYVGFYDDLYTGIISGVESDEFENVFGRLYENIGKDIFEKVVRNVKLSESDLDFITKYLMLQYTRTPVFLLNNIKLWKDTASKVINNINLKNIKPNGNIVSHEYDRLLPIKATRIKEGLNEFLEIETSVGKGFWLYAIKHHMEDTIKLLPKYEWTIVHAPQNYEWPTSDNPVILLNYASKHEYNFGGGWGYRGTQIIMPLTPRHVITTVIGKQNQEKEVWINKHTADIYTKMIIENAFEFIYHTRESVEILKFRKRRIMSEEEQEEKRQFIKWLKEQLDLEKEISNSN